MREFLLHFLSEGLSRDYIPKEHSRILAMRDQFKFADGLDVADKTVLLRIDVNVPIANGVG